MTLGLRLAGGAAIAIVSALPLVFAQLTIHNAVALAFPAWVPLGNQRPRGLDAMGQRLIMLGGTWLLLVLAALPGAVAGGIVWFALALFIGSAALVPAAAVVCASILAMEVLLATEALGPAYQRLDCDGGRKSRVGADRSLGCRFLVRVFHDFAAVDHFRDLVDPRAVRFDAVAGHPVDPQT